MSGAIFTNRDVSRQLAAVADLMRLKGANHFRIAAIQRAARRIAELDFGIADAVFNDTLEDIEGIGKGIASEIRSLFEKGEMDAYRSLTEEFPAGLLDVMRVPHVGPKKALALWRELDIADLDALRQAIQERKLRGLKGFTARTEATLEQSLEQIRNRPEAEEPIGAVLPALRRLMDHMSGVEASPITRMSVTGELRQWRETMKRPAMIMATEDVDQSMACLLRAPAVAHVEPIPPSRCRLTLHEGFEVLVIFTAPQNWNAALFRSTGDDEFWQSLIRYGERRQLDVEGILEAAGTEEEFFTHMGLPYLAPEQRTLTATPDPERATPASHLVNADHLQGELHSHTTYSDGRHTLREMAEAAMSRGYAYWAITDHGQGHGFGDSLDGAQLALQADEIDQLNRHFQECGQNFFLLKGVEAEILADGALGLDDDVLSRLDVVVASIHGSLRQDARTITERCLAAIANPHVKILGHPTSRLVGHRDPTLLDMPAVLAACRATGTAVEINCNPARLDVNDHYARMAAEMGCQLVLNCDAHAQSHLRVMEYGLGVARRAGLKPTDVLNTRSLPEILDFVQRGR